MFHLFFRSLVLMQSVCSCLANGRRGLWLILLLLALTAHSDFVMRVKSRKQRTLRLSHRKKKRAHSVFRAPFVSAFFLFFPAHMEILAGLQPLPNIVTVWDLLFFLSTTAKLLNLLCDIDVIDKTLSLCSPRSKTFFRFCLQDNQPVETLG